MKIPKASRDLWRTILSEVTARSDALCMDFWHSNELREKAATGCGSAHCIAGWVVIVTPGGIELSRHIEALFEQRGRGAISDLLSPDIIAADECAEATAALAILHESGWQAYVSADHFFGSDKTALAMLHDLARIEAGFEDGYPPAPPPVDRTATTVIP